MEVTVGMPWRLDWDLSGFAKRVTAIFSAISDLGVDVTIYCLGPQKEGLKFKVKSLSVNSVSEDDVFSPLFNSLGFSHEFAKHANQDKNVFIHCFNTTSLFLSNKQYLFETANPTYAYAMDAVKDEYPKTEKYRRFLKYYSTVKEIERIEYEKATLIIASSEVVKNNILRYYEVDKDLIKVIPNGVTPEQCNFNRPPKSKDMNIVLFPGTVHVMKGFHYLVDAMVKVRKELPNTILLVCGRLHPFESDIFESLIRRMRKKSGIALTGYLPQTKLHHYYHMADVCCIPLLFGTMSNALLESLAHGLPIVTTAHSGFPEIDKVGIEVTPKDSGAIAEAIITLISNPKMCKKKSENAQKIIKNYYWTDISKKFTEIYSSYQN